MRVGSINRRPAITERRVRFLDLLNLCVLHDADALPIAGETFEEVIPLHVAVIIRAWHIGRIQIDKIDAVGFQAEHVGAFDGVAAAIVEHYAIERLDLFKKMLLDAKPQIAASVVVTREIARHGEHPARLFFQAGADHGGSGQGSLRGMCQIVYVCGDSV